MVEVNPTGFRTGVMTGWKSRWYLEARVCRPPGRRQEDRDFVEAGSGWQADVPMIAKIEIERTRDEVGIVLFSLASVLIGRKGERVRGTRTELQNLTGRRINMQIEEINRPELVAQLVAEDICEQLQKPSQLSPHDEADDGTDDGGRLAQGNQDSVGRAAWRG